jgi:hypothetical protein
MKLPKTKENLLVQDLPDEILVFDISANKSYCLNDTAKVVFNACDGVKTFDDINLSEEIIYLSLDELKKNNLIQDNHRSPFAGMNRREVIRKVGLASMIALPVISSLSLPSAAAASSLCIGNGQSGGPGAQVCEISAAECNERARSLCFSCTGTFSTGDPRCVALGDPNGGICTCN